MPMLSLLERGSFDPKSVAVLVETFNGVVAELRLQTPAERKRAAKVVIRLARDQTRLEAANLHAAVLAELGS
jgi:hypothetical protein